jgi:RNA polymerase sigma-70 factor (ECF subfamily)
VESAIGVGVSVLRNFEEFYGSEYSSVFRAVYLAIGDAEAARDATQEAFKRAFVRWRRLSREAWAGGWVMTTALNVGRQMRRSYAREVSTDLADETVPPLALEDHVDLVDAIRTLPFRQRQAIVLYYIADLPLPVIADFLRITEGAIKAHLAQARSSLRRVMGEHHA